MLYGLDVACRILFFGPWLQSSVFYADALFELREMKICVHIFFYVSKVNIKHCFFNGFALFSFCPVVFLNALRFKVTSYIEVVGLLDGGGVRSTTPLCIRFHRSIL